MASDMKGTNVTGVTYNDPTVPWASYFNGGDALHGFLRAHYGYPQSNGCVEMPITTAGMSGRTRRSAPWSRWSAHPPEGRPSAEPMTVGEVGRCDGP